MTQSRRRLSMPERRQGRDETPAAVIDDVSLDNLQDVIEHGHGRIATAVVEDISLDGIAMVVVNGRMPACEASSLLRFPSADAAAEALLGRTVLVILNPQAQPVIVGAVAQRLWDKQEGDAPYEVQAKLSSGDPLSVQIDRRRIDLEASQEIRLTCGKSCLLLRRDGTVIVRGVKIVSRASQSNKIRGGTVSVN